MNDILKEIVENYKPNEPSVYKEWDFNTVLGCTIKEKFEGLMLDIMLTSRELSHNGRDEGYDWIWGSPEAMSIIETSTFGFEPSTSENYQITDRIYFCGTFQLFSRKWYLVKDRDHDPVNSFIVGKGSDSRLLTIKNFII